jgi:hypothetical protein
MKLHWVDLPAIPSKEKILEAIDYLKKEQPHCWRSDVRKLLNLLRKLDDPFAEHVDNGTDARGRKTTGHWCPQFDREANSL